MEYTWSNMNCAVTVCDKEGTIIFMNDKARSNYEQYGDLTGKNLRDCHSERSWSIIRRLLATGGSNAYTIEKRGIRKMIYQSAWFEGGQVGGLTEISMEIPAELPHYIRTKAD